MPDLGNFRLEIPKRRLLGGFLEGVLVYIPRFNKKIFFFLSIRWFQFRYRLWEIIPVPLPQPWS